MSSSYSNVSASGLPTGSSGTILSLPPLDNTLGAILIAEILISMLFGITTLQMYIYFNRNPRDNRWMKGAMISLWHVFIISLPKATSHFSFNCLLFQGIGRCAPKPYLPHYLPLYCSQFYEPSSFVIMPMIDMIFGGLSDAIVTGIFAHRIWRYSSNARGLRWSGRLKFPLYEDLKKHYSWLWYMTFVTQSFSDVAIATTVSAMLIKRRTGFRHINTGALTSSVSVASVIIYAAVPDNLIFIALAMLLPKSTVSARTVTDEPSQLSGSRSQDPYASDYKDDEILTGIKITRDKVVTVSPA
ncbi:hypothetical protein BC629DRAFT_1440173 [Irpex lacteus]|nr:hypothetical protein BC629DRAFT_1440173 [Irpex lacteus]